MLRSSLETNSSFRSLMVAWLHTLSSHAGSFSKVDYKRGTQERACNKKKKSKARKCTNWGILQRKKLIKAWFKNSNTPYAFSFVRYTRVEAVVISAYMKWMTCKFQGSKQICFNMDTSLLPGGLWNKTAIAQWVFWGRAWKNWLFGKKRAPSGAIRNSVLLLRLSWTPSSNIWINPRSGPITILWK